MKTKGIILVCCILLMHTCFAQKSFYGGALVVSTSFGVDGNYTSEHLSATPEQPAQTLNGTAPSSEYTIGAEFGLFSWLGLGLVGRINDYYTLAGQPAPSTVTQAATDVGATGNIHILKWKHLDAFAGYDFGIARVTYNDNTGVNGEQTATGTWSDIHATARIYFHRFGFNISFYVPGMSYNNFRIGSTNFVQYTANTWKSTGYGASLGLQYRIL